MSETRNEWNDPPGVDWGENSPKDRKRGDEGPSSTQNPRMSGPFSGLRRMLFWGFWGGLVIAIALGVAGATTAAAVPLVLGYLVTFGFWTVIAWGVLWFIDAILVYLKS